MWESQSCESLSMYMAQYHLFALLVTTDTLRTNVPNRMPPCSALLRSFVPSALILGIFFIRIARPIRNLCLWRRITFSVWGHSVKLEVQFEAQESPCDGITQAMAMLSLLI
jgi:hypothetical protein